ncbi:hypothetical protein B4114_0601 [Geobacillus stearothermophilus]|uniref:Uncharacterized protein n=1 Tax=Geobacillus stearothermophilus TaxID=1422 RepID=A0A150N3B2_GEOSE|nr:hypothetical protein B4114_0601 [Geobacillus stearothermophilus]
MDTASNATHTNQSFLFIKDGKFSPVSIISSVLFSRSFPAIAPLIHDGSPRRHDSILCTTGHFDELSDVNNNVNKRTKRWKKREVQGG